MGTCCIFLRVPVGPGETGISDRSVSLDEKTSQAVAMFVESQDQ